MVLGKDLIFDSLYLTAITWLPVHKKSSSIPDVQPLHSLMPVGSITFAFSILLFSSHRTCTTAVTAENRAYDYKHKDQEESP